MSRHESLTRQGYCEACYGPLVVVWLLLAGAARLSEEVRDAGD